MKIYRKFNLILEVRLTEKQKTGEGIIGYMLFFCFFALTCYKNIGEDRYHCEEASWGHGVYRNNEERHTGIDYCVISF